MARRADIESASLGSLAISRGEGPRTYRLAIGLFRSWGPLSCALGNLSTQQLPVESLCLIGVAPFDSLDGMPEIYGNLLERVRKVGGLFSADAYSASHSTLLDDICRSLCIVEEGQAGYPSWLMGSQCERISAHLETGGLVLVVSSNSPTQQDASTRILLRHSQHGVQTHDFTVRPQARADNGNSQSMSS